MNNYLWLKWIDYSPFFDGATLWGAEIGEPDAEAVATPDWGLQELSYYDGVITRRETMRLPHTYLVSYGDLHKLTDDNATELFNQMDSDSVWFLYNQEQWVFLPNPEGEYAYFLITQE